MKAPVPNPGPGLQGLRRRVIYVTLYELIAIVVVTAGLAWLTEQGAGHSGVVAVATSAIAVLWSLLFNGAFEHWESRQTVRGRNVRRRIAHAVGFEGGLVVILVPLLAWWFGVSLWQAFMMDLALTIFFLGYAFVFHWVFDQLFGLPAAAAQTLSAPVAVARPGTPGRND